MIYVSPQCLQRRFPPNRVQVFSSPWAIYRCVTANMKVIKAQSDPSLRDLRLLLNAQLPCLFLDS